MNLDNDTAWERKGEQVRVQTREACRLAGLWTPPGPPPEDEDGYVQVRQDAIKGPDWRGPQDDEWRDGEHWSWLFGDSPWASS